MIEERLIEEMLELRGGKTRLRDLREEILADINRLQGALAAIDEGLGSDDDGNGDDKGDVN